MTNTGFTDFNLFTCVLNEYKTANSVDDEWLSTNLGPDDALPEAGLANITNLACSNQAVTNTVGLNTLPNLQTLDISNNSALYAINVSENAKLQSINIQGLPYTYYDFSGNPDLETIETDRSLSLRTIDYVKKVEETVGSAQYQYAIEMDNLKFLDASSTHAVGFPDKEHVDASVSVTFGGYTHQVLTRGGYMNYAVYLEGDEQVETHSPIYLSNNCSKSPEGYYTCNNAVYYGDTFNTDDITNDILKKIFNLSDYSLSKVEVVPSSANVNLTTDTDTTKAGMVLADANFTINFHFEHNENESGSESESDIEVPNTGADVKAPDTGNFTSEHIGLIAGTSAAAIAILGIIARFSHYTNKRRNAKVRFGKR